MVSCLATKYYHNFMNTWVIPYTMVAKPAVEGLRPFTIHLLFFCGEIVQLPAPICSHWSTSTWKHIVSPFTAAEVELIMSKIDMVCGLMWRLYHRLTCQSNIDVGFYSFALIDIISCLATLIVQGLPETPSIPKSPLLYTCHFFHGLGCLWSQNAMLCMQFPFQDGMALI